MHHRLRRLQKAAGATVALGGDRHGTEGYFINHTIFIGGTPEMKIVQEEIFGPVGVIKFMDVDGMCLQLRGLRINYLHLNKCDQASQ